jgi:hypothetical protein
MNTNRYIAAVIFSAVAFSAHARDPNKIVLSCPVDRTPSMQAVADVVGTTNFWSTYHARERVIELAKQACKRGAVAVNIVPGTEPSGAIAKSDANESSSVLQ